MIGNILALSALSGLFYRAGGFGRPFKTWVRDWLIPGIVIAIMILVLKIKAPWWAWAVSYGLIGGSLTTYWDDSDDPFKDTFDQFINWIYPKDNFYLHGLFVGLGLLPIVIWGSLGWIPFIIRAIILGGAMGLINYVVNKFRIPFRDWIEELFRGALIVITLLLL